jgi:23S rRNA pseudouridine1911/1915/1917 synthase
MSDYIDKRVYTVEAENPEPMRIDKILSNQLSELSRSQIDADSSLMLVNGKPAKKSTRASYGDTIELTVFHERIGLEPEAVDLNILYEDRQVIVLNKQQGLVVHPAAGNWHETMIHGLLNHCREFDTDESIRPGIVHRLDKDTSGTIIAAKNAETQEFLSSQFLNRSVRKRYIAIVKGTLMRRRGTVSTQIVRDPRNRKRFMAVTDSDKGKSAVTKYHLLRQYQGYALMSFELVTGRTHQIRVHAAHLGYPILGDPVYSRKDSRFPEAALMLHALSLEIDIPPADGSTPVRRRFVSPMPDRFKVTLRQLRASDNR